MTLKEHNMTGRTWMAGIALGAAALLAAGTGQAMASGSAGGNVHQLSFYEKNSSITYTPQGGTTQQGAPQGPPAAGGQIEFSDLDYSGTYKHHNRAWTGSDHFVCDFNASDVPTCNGQLALNGSMVIIEGAGGQGDFSIPIVGGTGSYLGETGTLKVADIGTTLNADVVVSLTK
jgi:hypothetical protein